MNMSARPRRADWSLDDWAQVRSRLEQSQTAFERAIIGDPQRLDALYRQRALQLAARGKATAAATAGVRVLVVKCGAEQYGIDLKTVLQVLPCSKCTPIPGGSSALVGVVNIRGEILSILSLRRLLEGVGSDPSDISGGYLALIRCQRAEFGIQIDQVERIALVAMRPVASAGNERLRLPSRYISGVTPEGIIVLDAPALATHPVFNGDPVFTGDRSP